MTSPATARTKTRFSIVLVALVLGAALVWWWYPSQQPAGSRATSIVPTAGALIPLRKPDLRDYAGSESCRNCHEESFALWSHSHHALAERLPNSAMDHAAFDSSDSFKHGSQETRIFSERTNFFVSTRGLSRTNEIHSVERVIGHDPLRQFLVAFPGGRWQALEAAYDPHSNQWFNVYGNEDRQPGEWGHWTGRGMNWNSMCAGCHNTRLAKNYSEATDSYDTAMAERSVGCEACHGPLKAHNEWQEKYGRTGKKDPTLPRFSKQQVVDNCGFCHARRNDLTGDFRPGDAFFDQQSFAIVDESDRFYPDGQVRDEDYEWSAFLGSRMRLRGVVCQDCHDPHSMKTLLPGNWLCLRCHDGSYSNAPAINPVEHSHHKVFGFDATGKPFNTDLTTYRPGEIKETGGECVNCHMPQTVYMQRHRRRDHGFSIPDPLLTKEFGIPNACNRCHLDKTIDWALEATEKWYGKKMDRPTRVRAEWISRARNGDSTARQPLLDLLSAEANPYWRAVAAGMLERWVGDSQVNAAIVKALDDSHPLVREQAVRSLEALAGVSGSDIETKLRGALQDSSRNVRISAAWTLRGGVPLDSPAVRELEQSLDINADQPLGQLQKGAYALAKNELQTALTHYQKAAAWDPNSAPIRHELAIALSRLGRSREAIDQLEAACRLEPNEAEYRFKLGLAWNELGSLDQTIASLEKAVQLDPRHARAWYNLGLARDSRGDIDGALEALSRAETVAPEDPRIPFAHATILLRLNRIQDAKVLLKRCLEISPDFTDARSLLQQISETPAR